MNYAKWVLIIATTVSGLSCNNKEQTQTNNQPVYLDVSYIQDYAVKYYFSDEAIVPQKVATDRNGIIQILASGKLYNPVNGHLQYP